MTTDSNSEAAGAKPPWSCSPLAGVVFTLLGGLLAFLLLQQLHPYFSNEEAANAFGILPAEVQAELDHKNSIFVFSLMGGLFAVGLAVGEAMSRKSILTAILGGVGSAVVGTGCGALTGFLGNMFFKFLSERGGMSELAIVVGVYTSTFAMLGGAVGLSAALFLSRKISVSGNCLLAGILAGISAGLLYPIVAALAIPSADTQVLIPVGSGERLLWCALSSGMIGAFIPAFATNKGRVKKEAEAEADEE